MAEQYLAISFTLKGRKTLEQIAEGVKKLAYQNPEATLIHGFMPKDLVQRMNFSTDLVDMLDNCFPKQINFYDKRQEMVEFVKSMGCNVYIIGEDIIDGVAIEYDLYNEVLPRDRVILIP
jgi:hypothetical protein